MGVLIVYLMRNEALEVNEAVKGEGEVCLAFSGGISSSLLLLAASRAGKKVKAVYVDTGFMRQGDYENAKSFVESISGAEFIAIDARDELKEKLKGIELAKDKVKIVEGAISNAVGSFAKQNGLRNVFWGGRSYNGPKVEGFKLLQPLAGMNYLSIIKMIRSFDPIGAFDGYQIPASGLAVRLSGKISADVIEQLRQITSAFQDSLKLVSRFIPVLFPVIIEEKRREDPMIPAYEAAVTPIFNMFGAHFTDIRVLSKRVDGGEGAGYGKVVTLEASDEEGSLLCPQRKMTSLVRNKLLSVDPSIGRVLLKVYKGEANTAVVIRTMQTYDLITAEPLHLPCETMATLYKGIIKSMGPIGVYFDLTSKPPGAIEFERYPYFA